MQIDDIEEEQDIQAQEITFENTIVNIDYAISKLRHNNNSNSEPQQSINPWPETAYIYRERAVLSTQLWLHNIEYFGLSKTTTILQQYYKYFSRKGINNQIISYFNFDLKLNILINTVIQWKNNKIYFDIHTLTIFDYIQYLIPITIITSQSIIATIIARDTTDTQRIFDFEIVSIGEFRTFYQDTITQHWRYYKETQELHRGINFQFYHNYDLFKAINYRVEKRIILKLNHFVHLEIVCIKKNYFRDIDKYYSEYNQLLITASNASFNLNQPHQIDRFDSINHIITEYYPQEQE